MKPPFGSFDPDLELGSTARGGSMNEEDGGVMLQKSEFVTGDSVRGCLSCASSLLCAEIVG